MPSENKLAKLAKLFTHRGTKSVSHSRSSSFNSSWGEILADFNTHLARMGRWDVTGRYLDANSREKPWPRFIYFGPDLRRSSDKWLALARAASLLSFSGARVLVHIVSRIVSLFHPRVPAHLINDPSGVYC